MTYTKKDFDERAKKLRDFFEAANEVHDRFVEKFYADEPTEKIQYVPREAESIFIQRHDAGVVHV